MLERAWQGVMVVVTFTLMVILAATCGGAMGSMVGIVARELSPPLCSPGSLVNHCQLKEVHYAK
jgi:hypothetical protein